MHTLEQLEKQQVGLRLHKYLIDEIEELTKEYNLNKTDIITEAIRAYIAEQKAKKVYDDIDSGFKEIKDIKDGKVDKNSYKSLDELIDEL